MKMNIENNLFLGRDPCDTKNPWKEFHIQAYVVQEARRLGWMVHGDQNGASKGIASAGRASATGMLPGWPDLCFITSGGPLWVELKRRGRGGLSKEQIELHKIMMAAGCHVETIYAKCPAEAWNQVRELVLAFIG